MPKLFALCRMAGSQPEIDTEATPVHGWLLCGQAGDYGAYLFSGTAAQLAAIDALPQAVGLVAVTEKGETKWAELDAVVSPAARTKVNAWLAARSLPTIPAGRTGRQVVEAVYRRLNARFELSAFDVAEGP